jgi:hypothetical protein
MDHEKGDAYKKLRKQHPFRLSGFFMGAPKVIQPVREDLTPLVPEASLDFLYLAMNPMSVYENGSRKLYWHP